jgi:hypothetical protein
MGYLSDIFGEPYEGIHATRVGPGDGLALVDVVATLVGAWLLSRWLGSAFVQTLVLLVLLGVAVHRALGVRTKLDELLFTAS